MPHQVVCFAIAVSAFLSTLAGAQAPGGRQSGLIVQLDCGDGQSTLALAKGNQCLVEGLDTDRAQVDSALRSFARAGKSGRVTAAVYDGKALPYLDNTVNAIIAPANTTVPRGEILRALAPRGVAKIGGETVVKPVPDAIDEWNHYLYNAQNNAVSNDTEVGPPKGLQWVTGPLWSRHHEHLSSVSAMVSAKGRLFYIFDEGSRASIQLPPKWKLIARDAFNGTLLWKRDINRWYTHLYALKSGPAILPRRLAAVGDKVYVALGIDQPLVQLDAASGKTLQTYQATANTEEVLVADGRLYVVVNKAPVKPDTFVWTDPVCWNVGNMASKERTWGGEPRSVMAVDADTGTVLWSTDTTIGPSTLAVDDQHVVFFDSKKLVCLDRDTGQQKWVSQQLYKEPKTYPSFSMPNLVLYKDIVAFAPENKIQVYSLATGEQLWTRPKLRGGHRSPDDLMCLEDLVWTADVAKTNRIIGYDLHSGEEKRNFPCDLKGYWFHHRCHRSKATVRYLMPSRTGIEYVDWAAEKWDRNHWVRGACLLGVIPANGLTYAPQHPCACYMESKLNGLNALTASSRSQSERAVPASQRLERGPAYDSAPVSTAVASPAEWPTYRANNRRGGYAATSVGPTVQAAWSTELGGKLSAMTAAGGKVFVSAIDAHTVYALDQSDGRVAWSYVAGGRVDSPPTFFGGRVYFGCHDGYVYCLRATDGALVWRYLAAPGRWKQVAFDHLESVWPVSGSVLIRQGIVYCVAGRSAFLDGGMRLCRIDAATGKLVSATTLDDKVPGTDEALDERMDRLNLPPALPDILSCDDRYLYMRSQEFTFEGKRTNIQADSDPTLQAGDNRHLFSAVGFLDDEWFHRTYWEYGGTVTSGCNFWFFSGRYAPAGRLMCFDDQSIYGFGRLPKYYMWTPALEYRLYAASKQVTPAMIERVTTGINSLKKKSGRWIFNREISGTLTSEESSVVDLRWSQERPSIQARGMALTSDQLFVAGPPDVLDEERAVTEHWQPEVQTAIQEQDAALLGQRGASLWVVARADGKHTQELKLASPPVWDGLAAADGKLFLAALDGTVQCFAGK